MPFGLYCIHYDPAFIGFLILEKGGRLVGTSLVDADVGGCDIQAATKLVVFSDDGRRIGLGHRIEFQSRFLNREAYLS